MLAGPEPFPAVKCKGIFSIRRFFIGYLHTYLWYTGEPTKSTGAEPTAHKTKHDKARGLDHENTLAALGGEGGSPYFIPLNPQWRVAPVHYRVDHSPSGTLARLERKGGGSPYFKHMEAK